jgi:hypothetical protein
MTALDIEAVASSTSSVARNAHDGSGRCPTPETAGRTKTRWLVDAVLIAVAAGAQDLVGPEHVSRLSSPRRTGAGAYPRSRRRRDRD